MNTGDNFIWVEKYRPKTVKETILPENLKETFQSIIDGGELPNMLFTGTAGLGKTTVAKSICNELNLDYIVVNGSEEGNIDTLRGKIKQFASSVSLQGGYKVVILDEADYLNPQSTQPALRGFIEEFSKNCRFILTCNYLNRVIEPLHSRCGVYYFNANKKDLPELALQMVHRVKHILDTENVKYDIKNIADLVKLYGPDWRRLINETQRNSISGTLSTSVANSRSNIQIKELVLVLKERKFKSMQNWVVNNLDLGPAHIFRTLYDSMYDYIKPESIGDFVMLIGEYQYKAAFVADHEVNMVAFMQEVMATVKFK